MINGSQTRRLTSWAYSMGERRNADLKGFIHLFTHKEQLRQGDSTDIFLLLRATGLDCGSQPLFYSHSFHIKSNNKAVDWFENNLFSFSFMLAQHVCILSLLFTSHISIHQVVSELSTFQTF